MSDTASGLGFLAGSDLGMRQGFPPAGGLGSESVTSVIGMPAGGGAPLLAPHELLWRACFSSAAGNEFNVRRVYCGRSVANPSDLFRALRSAESELPSCPSELRLVDGVSVDGVRGQVVDGDGARISVAGRDAKLLFSLLEPEGAASAESEERRLLAHWAYLWGVMEDADANVPARYLSAAKWCSPRVARTRRFRSGGEAAVALGTGSLRIEGPELDCLVIKRFLEPWNIASITFLNSDAEKSRLRITSPLLFSETCSSLTSTPAATLETKAFDWKSVGGVDLLVERCMAAKGTAELLETMVDLIAANPLGRSFIFWICRVIDEILCLLIGTGTRARGHFKELEGSVRPAPEPLAFVGHFANESVSGIVPSRPNISGETGYLVLPPGQDGSLFDITRTALSLRPGEWRRYLPTAGNLGAAVGFAVVGDLAYEYIPLLDAFAGVSGRPGLWRSGEIALVSNSRPLLRKYHERARAIAAVDLGVATLHVALVALGHGLALSCPSAQRGEIVSFARSDSWLTCRLSPSTQEGLGLAECLPWQSADVLRDFIEHRYSPTVSCEWVPGESEREELFESIAEILNSFPSVAIHVWCGGRMWRLSSQGTQESLRSNHDRISWPQRMVAQSQMKLVAAVSELNDVARCEAGMAMYAVNYAMYNKANWQGRMFFAEMLTPLSEKDFAVVGICFDSNKERSL